MAGAIAVQQHDDVVNLSTISHKKTGYRFAFGKYVIQVSLWHLFGERLSISNQPSLYKGDSMSVAHKKLYGDKEQVNFFLNYFCRHIISDCSLLTPLL